MAKLISAKNNSYNVKRPKYMLFGVLILAIIAGSFAYPSIWNKSADKINLVKNKVPLVKTLPNIPQFTTRFPFKLGLDLLGGTHLVYQADFSQYQGNKDDAMESVRNVIENRVNPFGVGESLVQVEKTGEHYRLVVELPGVKDISEAIKIIGETPMLQFKVLQTEAERDKILAQLLKPEEVDSYKDSICKNEDAIKQFILQANQDPCFIGTALTGKYLKGAELQFNPNTGEPVVSLQLDDEGAKLFEAITEANIGKTVAIYLDGLPLSMPTVQEKISGGQAQISGRFTPDSAKLLASSMKGGALAVPIELINQQSVGATLGEASLKASLKAGAWGILVVIIFMILFYRLPGFLASIALVIYTAIALMIFKMIPVTLTLPGITGFILSIGMAVDANILIFERMIEEMKWGRSFGGAVDEGFKRAWTSIRDSNISSIITCIILFWLGTSLIKGFAFTLFIGICVSMFSAIVITRTFLRSIIGTRVENWKFLLNIPKKLQENK